MPQDPADADASVDEPPSNDPTQTDAGTPDGTGGSQTPPAATDEAVTDGTSSATDTTSTDGTRSGTDTTTTDDTSSSTDMTSTDGTPSETDATATDDTPSASDGTATDETSSDDMAQMEETGRSGEAGSEGSATGQASGDSASTEETEVDAGCAPGQTSCVAVADDPGVLSGGACSLTAGRRSQGSGWLWLLVALFVRRRQR